MVNLVRRLEVRAVAAAHGCEPWLTPCRAGASWHSMYLCCRYKWAAGAEHRVVQSGQAPTLAIRPLGTRRPNLLEAISPAWSEGPLAPRTMHECGGEGDGNDA